MSDGPPRFDNVRRSVRVGVLLGGGSALVLLCAGLGLAFSAVDAEGQRRLIGIGVVGLSGVGIAILVAAWGLVDLIIKTEANTFRSHDVLRDISAVAEQQRRDMQVIAENVQLSEAARSISHRAKERTVLRLAINEETIKGDWEAAYALVDQLETRYGYRNEAARLRAELDRSRQLSREQKLHDRIASVKAHMQANEWDIARREMDQLVATNGDHPEVQTLPELFARSRDDHKRRLLKAWDESVQRNEVDRGIAILKELDQFLTPSEAAALEESARGVFRAKLHNLGVQFSLAVTERNWKHAFHIGRTIMAEFPNSRMAAEVRERHHILRKRSEEAEAVPAAAGS